MTPTEVMIESSTFLKYKYEFQPDCANNECSNSLPEGKKWQNVVPMHSGSTAPLLLPHVGEQQAQQLCMAHKHLPKGYIQRFLACHTPGKCKPMCHCFC